MTMTITTTSTHGTPATYAQPEPLTSTATINTASAGTAPSRGPGDRGPSSASASSASAAGASTAGTSTASTSTASTSAAGVNTPRPAAGASDTTGTSRPDAAKASAADPAAANASYWGGYAPESLSPEAVVAMLFNQLGAMDVQIQDRVQEMTSSLQTAEGLSGNVSDLKALAAHLASKPTDQQKLKPDDTVTMPGGEQVTVKQVLDRSGAGYLATEKEITLGAIQSAVESKTTDLSRHNSGKEQSLIQMQSNLQSRQQIIAMATQMLNAIHQPLNQIANNIGR